MEHLEKNKKVLSKKEVIKLPNEELQIDLYYNNLTNKQLAAAKQEIKNTFYDFKNLYGIKEYGTNKTLSIFMHDNKEDYYEYGYTYASYCVNDKDRENANVANIYHNASGQYNGDDPSNRTLRNQVSYALSYYNNTSDKILPNKHVAIEIPESNVQVKLGINSLNNRQVEIAKKDITDTFKDLKFDTPIKIELNKHNHLDGLDDNILVSTLKETYPDRNYDQESAKKAFEDPIVRRDVSIILSTDGTVERSEELLSNKEIIEFPRYNLEADLHYRDLDEYQVWRAKQEIKSAVYDFKESFGLEASDVLHKFRNFFYDTRNDYINYTGADHGGHADGTNAYTYLTIGYDVLRHEFVHNIMAYTKVDDDDGLPTLLNHNIVGHIQRGIYPINENNLYKGTHHIAQYLKDSKFDVYERVYVTIEFFQKAYPELIHEMFYNRKSYGSALEFFKDKFPDMVSHIPNSDKDLYKKYDEKLLNKIFENKGVKQKLLDFIEAKLDEKKYIEKAEDINVFRVVKGDHIGTDKNTDEEYYGGIIVDNKGEIGSFSPVEYSYSPKGINVFNHATKDTITIPKEYRFLKLVKVDGNYKLAFCDKFGYEYKNTQTCKNQTKNLIYTDNAPEAFALVDLPAVKGIAEQEKNLGKVFSLKPTNLKHALSPISIHDGNKNVGSFTDEVGYISRGKFYFKDNHSTDFKVYDENRALITITKENGEHQVSLRDGQYVDDSKFLSQGTQLNGNNIDYIYYRDRETGEISKMERSLLFKHEPEKEETIEFDEYNFTVRVHHDLPDDQLQKAINEVKNTLPEFKTLLNLKENNVSFHELQLYIHDNENSYRKYTGSTTGYGHFNSKLNKMYISQSTYYSGDITLKPVIKLAQNHRLLPNKEVINLPEYNLQMDVYYNKLNYKQLKDIKNEIIKTCDDFKKLYGIKEYDTTKTFSIFIHDNEENFSLYGSPYTYSHGVGLTDRSSSHVAYIFHNPNGDNLRTQVSFALAFYNDTWDWSKILPDVVSSDTISNSDVIESEIQDSELEEEEVVDFPQYNLKVRIHYNDLNDNQLTVAEEEIKKTFSDFDKSFGLKGSNTSREFQIYIYDDADDFKEHTGSGDYGIAYPDWNDDNVAKMSIYKFDDDGVGFAPILRHELTHGLTFYSNGPSGITCGQKTDYGLTSFILEGIAYYLHKGSNFSQNLIFNPEDYYNNGYRLVSLLEHYYPDVINSIIHNSKLYKDALKHFKTEFPDFVSHISDSESFPLYNEAFFKRIFDNDRVVQKFSVVTEVSSKRNDDSIFGDENSDEISMSYEMIKSHLHITDDETGKTIKIPKQFKYLKLVEDDEGEYKFALCTKKGHVLSDYKKYAKIDSKYKYINTEIVDNSEEEIDFDDYDEEDIFYIQADKFNSQIIRILDIYEDEIGTLPNNSNNAYYLLYETDINSSTSIDEKKVASHHYEPSKAEDFNQDLEHLSEINNFENHLENTFSTYDDLL